MTASWVPSSWDAVKTGDTVRLEHGDGTTLDGTVQLIVAGIPPQELLGIATSVGWKRCIGWAGLGWSLFTPAPTTPVLPDEPGAFHAANWSSTITLNAVGEWHDDYGNRLTMTDTRMSGALTRLEPVATTATAVLERVEAYLHDELIAEVIREFGGTP